VRLEKLQMRGFKTFADSTQLEFGAGVTAIVGPNGVGKSNIADAVLWVLGEQGHRVLRVESAEAVIFVGSENRRALGMAEVVLTLDNSDYALASEYSQIEITRRLFRTGKSEYLLNRNQVRLRDIRDLLVDSGLGTDSYALVGQGEIDAILSARPEDRRELLEEVAGVRKYRIRRTEAERKLANTEDNLTRVCDIIYELRAQREPLEKQAEIARQYKGLAERLHQIQRDLLAAEYETRRERRGGIVNDLAVIQADLQATRNQISVLEAEYEQSSTQATALADQLDDLRRRAADAEREWDRRRNAQAVAAEKLRSVGERREQLEQGLKQAQQRRKEAQNALHKLEQNQSRHQDALDKEKRRLTELATSYQESEARHRQDTAQRESLHNRRSELSGEAAAADREVTALQSLQVEVDERIERLSQQQAQLEQQRDQLQTRLAELREENEALQQGTEDIRRRLREARVQHTALVTTLREHRRKRDLLAEAVAAGESRQALLRELARAHEGYAEGPRALLDAGQAGELSGVVGVLADLLDVPGRLEAAVEAGLGDRLQWVLVASEDEARRCIAYLRENRLGRATVLATNVPPPSFASRASAGVSRTAEGVLGTIESLVRYPKKMKHVLDHVLGDVVIVEDLETAARIRHTLTGAVRLVTLSGEVVGPLGEVTAGNLDEGVQQSFKRQRQLAELEGSLQGLRDCLARMWETEEELERRDQELADSVHDWETQLVEADKQATGLEGELGHTADRFRAAKAAYQELVEEIAAVRERCQSIDTRLAETQRQHRGLLHELEQLNGELSGLASEQVIDQSREKLREKLTAVQVKVAELEEKFRSTQLLAQQQQQELSRAEQEVADYQAQSAQLDEIEQAARQALQLDEGETTQLEQQAVTLREQADACQQQVSELRHSMAELELGRRKLGDLREEQTERLHRLELRETRHDSELEHLVEELREVYELTPEQALAQRPEDFNLTQSRREAKQLKEEIRALGYVNVSAIEECERLWDRENYLNSQVDDLKQARNDLEQVIAEIDETAKDVFLKSFGQVAEAFDDLFRWLFGGGSTRLELTDPQDPLNSGVEVIIQQPGRRSQNLMALSGGEKALTALALLFAMIRVKPAPFCILDEIDAALDAANSQRFGELLMDFAEDSQFIIITHNPETMEIADTLHGVTMEQPGVSKLISVELAEAQKEAERWAASNADRVQEPVPDVESAPA